MAGASFSVLLLLVALSFLGCEASSYLVPGNNTGIAIPTFVSDTGGMFYDVYADQSRNVFLILAGNGLYQMDYARTTLLAHHSFSCCSGNYPSYLLYTDIAADTGFVYVNPSVSFPYQVLRFSVTNVTLPTVYNATIDTSFQMAIGNFFGFLVGQNDAFVEIFDLITMTFVNRFNYTQNYYPWFDPTYPGGWGIAVDSIRDLLYIGVDCDSPTPGFIWQWNVSDFNNTNLVDSTVWGADPCFNYAFVEVADGRAWFYEDDAGFIGGFSMNGLSWGSDYSVPTVNYRQASEYDPNIHTAYFLDRGSGGSPKYTGQVYRACLLDPGNIIHEVLPWQQLGQTNNVCGSYLEYGAPTSTLYVVDCSINAVMTVTILNGTDCPQSPPSSSSCTSSASTLSGFMAELFSYFLFC